MAEERVAAPALDTNIESGGFDEKKHDAPATTPAAPGISKKPAEDEDEDEDIDALIEDLESQDGHAADNDEEEEDTNPGLGRTIPEDMLQTDSRVGLTESEVTTRRRKYGLNQMKEEKENLVLKFLGYFIGPIQFVMEVSLLLLLRPIALFFPLLFAYTWAQFPSQLFWGVARCVFLARVFWARPQITSSTRAFSAGPAIGPSQSDAHVGWGQKLVWEQRDFSPIHPTWPASLAVLAAAPAPLARISRVNPSPEITAVIALNRYQLASSIIAWLLTGVSRSRLPLFSLPVSRTGSISVSSAPCSCSTLPSVSSRSSRLVPLSTN